MLDFHGSACPSPEGFIVPQPHSPVATLRLGRWLHVALLTILIWLTGTGAAAQVACDGDAGAEGTWQTVPAMAQGTFDYTLTLLPSGKVLAIGGKGGNLTEVLDRVELFDPVSRSWQAVGNLQVARRGHSATLLRDGKVLVVGGLDEGDMQVESAEIYDPESHTSILIPVLGRYDHTATMMLDGRVLITGGERIDAMDEVYLTQVDLYDPELGWRAAVSSTTARHNHTATRLADGRIVLIGGSLAVHPVTAVDICVPDPDDGCAWQSGASFADSRSLHGATLLENGRILVAGGFNGADGDTVAASWIYESDAGIGSWSAAGSLVESRRSFGMALLPSGQVWVGGGRKYQSDARVCDDMASAEIYSPTLDQWRSARALEVGRYSMGVVVLPSGGILVAGGKNEGILDLQSNGIYRPGVPSWVSGADLPTGRRAHEGRLMPTGELAVFSGREPGNDKVPEIETYDPSTETWTTETATLAEGRSGHVTALLQDGRIVVVGGRGAVSGETVELFNPSDRSVVTAVPILSTTRIVPTATVLVSGELLVCGGWDGGTTYSDTCDLLNFELNTVETLSMSKERYRHTATRLPSGEVLIVGGVDSTGSLTSVELFDPISKTFRPVASAHHKRWRHGAALLPGGRVLISGGGDEAVATAEIYAPHQDLWFEVPPMIVPRSRHEMWTLPTGEVLAISGRDTDRNPIPSTEIYDPVSNAWRLGAELAVGRYESASDLLLDGRVVVAGGNARDAGNLLSNTFELWDPYDLSPTRRRPTVTTAPSVVVPGGTVEITGTGLFGDFTAGGDHERAAGTDAPVLFFRSFENTQLHPAVHSVVSVSGADPTTATLSVEVPESLDPGYHALYVVSSGVPSVAHVVRSFCKSGLIAAQPSFDGDVVVGEPAMLVVSAPRARFLQWQVLTDDGWADVDGGTESTFLTEPVAAADVGRSYRVQAFNGCAVENSLPLILNLTNNTAPTVEDIEPGGGEYWLFDAETVERVSWTATDEVRICGLEVDLVASATDETGGPGCPAYQEVAEVVSEDLGLSCAHPGLQISSKLHALSSLGSAAVGDRFRIRVKATNAAGLSTTVCSGRSFNIIDEPDNFRTVILTDMARMQSVFGLSADAREALEFKIDELAAHPRVDGLVVELDTVPEIVTLNIQRDGDTSSEDSANEVLFGANGIHPYLLKVLEDLPEVKYLMVVGDDRIIPMARLPDETVGTVSEQVYAGDAESGAFLSSASTVGKALSMNRFLSDDPLASATTVELGGFDNGIFAPDRAVGRLVETPEEITTAIDTFLRLQGRLDLRGVLGSQVVVTGYDFLDDSARRIADEWQEHLPAGAVDDALIGSDSWDVPGSAHDALLARLEGPRIFVLNGHADHTSEGVPGGTLEGFFGLETFYLYGDDAEICAPDAPAQGIHLYGSVIYAVGCHSGLPVPGSCDMDADRPLDLPQTFLARGALAYIANSGFGWGLLHGVGYSERLQLLMTDELLKRSVFVGEAMRLAKLRYYSETPRLSIDPYARKTLMQWTMFGFPMAEILAEVTPPPAADAGVRTQRRILTAKASTPSRVTRIEQTFYFDGADVYEGFSAAGNLLPFDGQGGVSCPAESEGCYFTLNGLVAGGSDQPLEPYFVYNSRLSGTSQHGVLWLGSRYRVSEPWKPLIGSLASNFDDRFDGAATPHTYLIGPLTQVRGPDLDPCRTTDADLENRLVISTGQTEKRTASGTAWQHRRDEEVDLEMLYFNGADPSSCDRSGPAVESIETSFADGTFRWLIDVPDPETWRVVVVYTDHLLDEQGLGHWLPVEASFEDVSGRWLADTAVDPAAERLTFVVQAVDTQANVGWSLLTEEEVPASGAPRNLNQSSTLLLGSDGLGCGNADILFCSGFELGTLDTWSGHSP